MTQDALVVKGSNAVLYFFKLEMMSILFLFDNNYDWFYSIEVAKRIQYPF